MKASVKTILIALFLSSVLSLVSCNPNTGKNVGSGCGTWDEAKKGSDTTKVEKGI